MTSTIDPTDGGVFTPSDFDPIGATNAVTKAAPGLDPKTAVAVAKTAKSPHEAVATAQATFHFGNTIRAYDQLQTMSPSQQASAWTGLSSAEQDSLRSVGFKPPKLDALTHSGAGGQHGGIWSAITSGVSHGLHDVGHAVTTGASDTLSALGKPLGFVQHAVRAAHVVSEMGIAKAEGWTKAYQEASGGGVSLDTNAFNDTFDVGSWAAAWRATANGNTSLDPAIQRHLVSQYGKSQVQLATRIAGAGSVDSVIQGAPASQRESLIKLTQSPKFQDLVNQVSNARMSVGRSLVGTKFMNSHPAAGKAISGAADATFDWFGDPLNTLGGAGEAARVGRWGIDGAEAAKYMAGDASRADDLLRSGGFKSWTDYVGEKYLSKGDYSGVQRFDPRFANVAPQWQREGIDSADKLRTWFSSNAGMAAMMSGDAAKLSHGFAIVPHLTSTGWAKAGVKDLLQKTLDRLADGSDKLDDDIDLDPETDVAGQGDLTHQLYMQGKAQHLSELMNAGKLAGQHGRISNVTNLPRILRRMSTLVPTKGFIDIGENSPDAANFKRFVQGFLPAKRVEDVTNAFISGDVGMRRRLVMAARKQMMHAAGAYNTPELSAGTDDFLAALGAEEEGQAYSVEGLDAMSDDSGRSHHSAILENQLSTGVRIPRPAEVRKMVQQHTYLTVLGIRPLVDKAMYYWRSLLLDRPGFAVRFALDENLGQLLRTSPRQVLASYLANGAARTMTDEQIEEAVEDAVRRGMPESQIPVERAALRAMAVKPLLPYHPIARIMNLRAQVVPDEIRALVRSPGEYYGATMGATTRNFVRGAQKAGLKMLGLQHYIDAATDLYTHQPVSEGFRELVSAVHGSPEYVWSPEGQVRALKDDSTAAIARFAQRGKWSETKGSDELYRYKWQHGLDQIAQSHLGRAVLESIDKSRRTQEDAVLRVLNDPGFADTKAMFERSKALPDGRLVGVNATQRQADRAFARSVVSHVNAHVRSSDPERGPLLTRLVSAMLETGSGPSRELIDEVRPADLPRSVYGPDVVPLQKFESFFSKSFEQLVGRPANWLTRQPHFIQEYAEARQELRPIAEKIASGENADKLLSDMAFDRAVNNIIPYIHNPALRTQFEDYHRNLFPFLFAQRQFLQRWGRTFADSPDGIRKIQLTMNGLRSSGFLHRDSSGNDYFYYPGSQYVQDLVTRSLSAIGIHSSIPMQVPFTGEVQYLMPGLDNPVTPSVGPFVSIGMKALATKFPELASANQTILGQGASTPMWQDLTPTLFNRVWAAFDTRASGQLASTTAQAIKYLDATGHGLPDNASPEQIEAYAARVQNWARSLLMVRAVMGFGLPATPTAELDPDGLDARLTTLTNELGYDKGVEEYMREHPDATAYTVSSSENATDGSTPATDATLSWMDSHQSFVENNKIAAAWFVPRSTGAFSPAAYREQIALGMRTLKPITASNPGEDNLIDDIIMARASNAYYQTLDNYNAAYDATTDSGQHQQLAHWWDNYKATFDKQNPIFAQYLASDAGHVKRIQTIAAVQRALDSNDVPNTPQTPLMRTVLDNYSDFQSQYQRLAGLHDESSGNQKDQMKAAFVAWLNSYAKRNPAVADFINTVIRPEADETDG